MFYHVYQKFPESVAAIEALASIDAGFAVLLADFEELSTWLATARKAGSTNNADFESAVELVRELEKDIRHRLESHHGINR